MSKSEMTTDFRKESPVLQARMAGGLWWLCILAGIVGFIAAAPLIVANDAAATAANILTKESLFRLGFAADVISGLSYLGVTVLIYYVTEGRQQKPLNAGGVLWLGRGRDRSRLVGHTSHAFAFVAW